MIRDIFRVSLAVSAIFIGLRVGGDLLRNLNKTAPAPSPATGQ